MNIKVSINAKNYFYQTLLIKVRNSQSFYVVGGSGGSRSECDICELKEIGIDSVTPQNGSDRP